MRGRYIFSLLNLCLEASESRPVALVGLKIILRGLIAILILVSCEPKAKQFEKTYGSFKARVNNETCFGEAALEGEKITFQIKYIPANMKFVGFRLYNRNVEIQTQSIEWVCAMMNDFRVIRCSTDLDLPKDNFDMFVDHGIYTISYSLKEPLANTKVGDISFVILTNRQDLNIKIEQRTR